MQKIYLFFIIMICSICALAAQSDRNPPTYTMSVTPASIMFSWYDYMIGSYNDNPVKVLPYSNGGGVLMAFHANPQSPLTPAVYLAHLNTTGTLQSLRSVGMSGSFSRYPSLDYDYESGVGFLAWHEVVGTDTYFTVCGSFIFMDGSSIDTLSTPLPVFNHDVTGGEYLWPVVRFGPSQSRYAPDLRDGEKVKHERYFAGNTHDCLY